MSIQTCAHCCTRIAGLRVYRNGRMVLQDIDVHINCRELLAIVGSNGAGKTTLLQAMLGEIPYEGSIHYQLRATVRAHPRIGYVPQKIGLDADTPISVGDFTAAALGCVPVWASMPAGVRRRICDVLASVHADELIDRRMGELSGGQLQRVLLSVAMTPVPDILLLDEPVSAVDVKGLELFYAIVRQLTGAHDISVIMATHDLAGVAPHADRMILLNRTIIAQGTPSEVLSDKKLLETFPLELWNISGLPVTRPQGGR